MLRRGANALKRRHRHCQSPSHSQNQSQNQSQSQSQIQTHKQVRICLLLERHFASLAIDRPPPFSRHRQRPCVLARWLGVSIATFESVTAAAKVNSHLDFLNTKIARVNN